MTMHRIRLMRATCSLSKRRWWLPEHIGLVDGSAGRPYIFYFTFIFHPYIRSLGNGR